MGWVSSSLKKNRRKRPTPVVASSVFVPGQFYAAAANEISPWTRPDGTDIPVDEVVTRDDPRFLVLMQIRWQKQHGSRPLPSANLTLIPEMSPSSPDHRARLLDAVAGLVDQNAFGRSEMCVQFAVLLERALRTMGTEATATEGKASYRDADGEWLTWPNHAWVITADGSLVDGNIDSVRENPEMPGLSPRAYWGPRPNCPDDRRFPDGRPAVRLDPSDGRDVERWWRELQAWLISERLVAP